MEGKYVINNDVMILIHIQQLKVNLEQMKYFIVVFHVYMTASKVRLRSMSNREENFP